MAHVIHTDSKAEWLEARRSIITATDMQKLHSTKTRRCWEEIVAAKEGKVDSFKGNRYTGWGNEREPEIAKWVRVFLDERLEWNEESAERYQDIYVSDENELWGCTPDMIGDGMCCQIKTAGVIDPDKYFVQCLWEKIVTGVEDHFLVIEPRLEDEAGRWAPGEPVHFATVATDEMVEALKTTAREFETFWLHGTDPEWMGGRTEGDAELAGLLSHWGELKREEHRIKDALDAVGKDIRGLVGVGTTEAGGYQVQVVQPKPTRRFDQKSFRADHAELAEQYMKESASSERMTIKEVA